MLNKFFRLFSHDIGIDLGTANTLVYVQKQGIVINEPSVVAFNQKTGQVVAVGNEAKAMVGRTPSHIVALRPLIEGVISDFEITQEMISYFIKKVHSPRVSFFARPRIVIGIPSGITEVERRAVREATLMAGAREVYLVEEPMAAAIGARLPIQEPVGNMIVDIGGGTTNIAVISLGGIVSSMNLRLAGDHLNQDIINYARDEFKLLIGERTAEEVKIAIGSVFGNGEEMECPVRGRDLITGLPREVFITDEQAREAMGKSIKSLVKGIKEVIEATPPELISDLMYRGIHLAGGGALLKGFDKLVEKETRIATKIIEDPMTAVVRGCGIILEDLDKLREVLVEYEEEDTPY
ncbi:MAG: rod shape-determining protein [Candidatus Niyogibacteria bacterium RIFCSPLOWO2_12_FULL_41_13]|uniref:Cell shape-determining protein MreB n=1 Tax=Candidatus Niyogibacteria bacterium RIFCSPLOWO2_12_FULL_41_13 TaxID=1801726 RepID=A0A1G2F270_9BACT|nr:MAG: rod shape-determining protein [Candidatus Niyogibacteria bacterium RIFCSPLOWO2_12_FULL_41_13]